MCCPAILLDKGIIVGIEQNISYRDSLGFVLFKMSPKVSKVKMEKGGATG